MRLFNRSATFCFAVLLISFLGCASSPDGPRTAAPGIVERHMGGRVAMAEQFEVLVVGGG